MPGNKKMFITIIHAFRDYPSRLALIKKTIRNQLALGFNINTKYLKGKTLAHYVVKYNVTGLFLYLVKCGLNLDICDDNYDTPLLAAVKNNRISLVKELINCKFFDMFEYVKPTAEIIFFCASQTIATKDPNEENVLPLPGNDLSFGEGIEEW